MKRTRWILALSMAMASAAPVETWAQVKAQTGEVVQATPSAAAVDSLNRNLAILSRSPQDVNALLGAAQAALDLGDVQAANGFFTRANLVNPNVGKAKLGLAIVEIALKQPDQAAANFDAAQALGESAQGHLAERGLAYDLTGQQAKAQRDYAAALRANPADEQARLRYAVSLGISGQVAEADQMLQPALTDGDREAWRLRAFIFAMNGRMAESRKVTQAVMPKGLADALDPYMQRVSLLTPAQKAAAAHYGEFPTNVLKLAAPEPVKERDVQVAAAAEERDAARRDRRNRNSSTRKPSSASAGKAAPAPAAAAPPPAAPPPQLASNDAGRPASAAVATTPPAPSPVRQPASVTPASVPPTKRDVAPPAPTPMAQAPVAQAPVMLGPVDPGSAPAAVAQPSASAPSPVASAPVAAQPTAGPGPSLADRLSALDVPAEEREKAMSADMSAVARIQDQRRKVAEAAEAKAKAEAEAKAKAEATKKAEAERKAKLAANPSRTWVQIATGRDVDALAFDLRRMRRTYSDAIGDAVGWTAEWGQTRRLLVGPFKKIEEARATVGKIVKSGGDAFVWQSDAGEEISKIGAK